MHAENDHDHACIDAEKKVEWGLMCGILQIDACWAITLGVTTIETI